MYINLIKKKAVINRTNLKPLIYLNSYNVNQLEGLPIFNEWMRSKYVARAKFLGPLFYGEIVVWKGIEIV